VVLLKADELPDVRQQLDPSLASERLGVVLSGVPRQVCLMILLVVEQQVLARRGEVPQASAPHWCHPEKLLLALQV
jgi:hypothetical protein